MRQKAKVRGLPGGAAARPGWGCLGQLRGVSGTGRWLGNRGERVCMGIQGEGEAWGAGGLDIRPGAGGNG